MSMSRLPITALLLTLSLSSACATVISGTESRLDVSVDTGHTPAQVTLRNLATGQERVVPEGERRPALAKNADFALMATAYGYKPERVTITRSPTNGHLIYTGLMLGVPLLALAGAANAGPEAGIVAAGLSVGAVGVAWLVDSVSGALNEHRPTTLALALKQQVAKVSYDLALERVERPDGQPQVATLSKDQQHRFLFEDQRIRIAWQPSVEAGFAFTLENRTAHSMKVLWDEAVFVDLDGGSHRVIHNGVKLVDKQNTQVPSIVARRSVLNDGLAPIDAYLWDRDEWRRAPFLPIRVYGTPEQMQQHVERYSGKTMLIVLPLAAAGVQHDYVFAFRIKGASLQPEA